MTDDSAEHQTETPRHEEWLREHVREDIEMYAEILKRNWPIRDDVENVEAYVAHIICSESNKHRRDGLD